MYVVGADDDTDTVAIVPNIPSIDKEVFAIVGPNGKMVVVALIENEMDNTRK